MSTRNLEGRDGCSVCREFVNYLYFIKREYEGRIEGCVMRDSHSDNNDVGSRPRIF